MTRPLILATAAGIIVGIAVWACITAAVCADIRATCAVGVEMRAAK